jgi:hypothetical protein
MAVVGLPVRHGEAVHALGRRVLELPASHGGLDARVRVLLRDGDVLGLDVRQRQRERALDRVRVREQRGDGVAGLGEVLDLQLRLHGLAVEEVPHVLGVGGLGRELLGPGRAARRGNLREVVQDLDTRVTKFEQNMALDECSGFFTRFFRRRHSITQAIPMTPV